MLCENESMMEIENKIVDFSSSKAWADAGTTWRGRHTNTREIYFLLASSAIKKLCKEVLLIQEVNQYRRESKCTVGGRRYWEACTECCWVHQFWGEDWHCRTSQACRFNAERRWLKIKTTIKLFRTTALPIRTGFCLLMLKHCVAGNFQIVAGYGIIVNTKTIWSKVSTKERFSFVILMLITHSQIVVLCTPAPVHIREAVYGFKLLTGKGADAAEKGFIE